MKKTFGFSKFKHPQAKIIDDLVVEKKDVVAILPTGLGKSLVYQFPPMLKKHRGEKGCTFVLSPLRSLVDDQVKRANKIGISAAELR